MSGNIFLGDTTYPNLPDVDHAEPRVKAIQVEAFNIKSENLDPIDVYIRMDSESAGRITIQCFDQCWTAYWGAMGGSMREFWDRCNVGYLTNSLQSKLFTNESVKAREDKYLNRIVLAVKSGMKESM